MQLKIGFLPSQAMETLSDENELLVSIKFLGGESNPDARVRRETDTDLPDQLSFAVPMHNADVTLRMRRARLIPTVTSHSPLAAPYLEDAAVYTDIEQGASMIVRRDSDEYTEYNLQGSFVHANTEWKIEPLSRSRRDLGGSDGDTHRVSPILIDRNAISLSNDAVFDNEPWVEILSLADRNRYRLERLGLAAGPPVTTLTGGGRQNLVQSIVASPVQHTVEMVFVVDYADYEKWVAYKGEANATREMTLWYTYIAETINVRFQTIIDDDIAMSTVVNFLKILTNESADDFIEDLISGGSFDGSAGLDAFRTWYQDPNNSIPNADHYMYFTGFDISSASGIAYVGAVCTVSGVSLNENDFEAGLGTIAAHELGHSLSADHDGDTGGNCTDSSQNIMATIFSQPVGTNYTGNPWRFSNCSIDFFKTYLASVSCTQPGNTGSADVLPAPAGNARAGVVLDRDDQCRLSFRNDTSSYCSGIQNSNGGESALCGGMYCSIPDNPGYCSTMVPLEYTACGSDKWCVLGFCVNVTADTFSESQSTPTAPATSTGTTGSGTTGTTGSGTTGTTGSGTTGTTGSGTTETTGSGTTGTNGSGTTGSTGSDTTGATGSGTTRTTGSGATGTTGSGTTGTTGSGTIGTTGSGTTETTGSGTMGTTGSGPAETTGSGPPATRPPPRRRSFLRCLRHLFFFRFIDFFRCIGDLLRALGRPQRPLSNLRFADLWKLRSMQRKGDRAAYRHLQKLLHLD